MNYRIDDVFGMNVVAFLNYAVYMRSKANVEKVQMDEIKRKIKSSKL